MLQPAYYHLKTDNTASFTQAYPTKQSAAFVKRVLVACSCFDNHICPIVLTAALTTISVTRRSLQDALTCWHWPHHLTSCSTQNSCIVIMEQIVPSFPESAVSVTWTWTYYSFYLLCIIFSHSITCLVHQILWQWQLGKRSFAEVLVQVMFNRTYSSSDNDCCQRLHLLG